jgi:uncharacterized membrane protein HdeD (DUF308 family)
MTSDFQQTVRRTPVWSMVFSALIIAAGVLAIALPMLAGVAVTGIAGWLLILAGILHFALAFGGGGRTTVLWEILLGVVYGVTGIFMVANPLVGLESLTLIVAIYLFIEGVLELVLSFQLRPAPGAWWVLLDGIVTLALAIWISATWPISSFWVIGTIVGISMIFTGSTRLMFWSHIRRRITA